jgi:hypothetical protein
VVPGDPVQFAEGPPVLLGFSATSPPRFSTSNQAQITFIGTSELNNDSFKWGLAGPMVPVHFVQPGSKVVKKGCGFGPRMQMALIKTDPVYHRYDVNVTWEDTATVGLEMPQDMVPGTYWAKFFRYYMKWPNGTYAYGPWFLFPLIQQAKFICQ